LFIKPVINPKSIGKIRPRHKRIKPKRHHIFNFGYKSLKLNNIIIRPKKAIKYPDV
jgi:hypothetical protein